MKKSISVVAIVAALFATGSALAESYREQVQWWNVDHPAVGTPGIIQQSAQTIKNIYCPGLNNVECAYLISNTSTIIKKP